MLQRLKQPETLMVILCIGLYLMVLYREPVIGVADNGDFARVMPAAGVQYLDSSESYEDRYFRYSHQEYAFGAIRPGGYASSQLPFLFLAGLIGRLVGGSFDIRILSALYMAVFAVALSLLVKGTKTRFPALSLLLVPVLALVFLDVGYLAYFNSFYGEPAALLFLLLTTALGFAVTGRELPSRRLLALFLLSAAALAGTKLQHAPIGIACALLSLRFARLRADRAWKRLARGGAAALVALSLLVVGIAPGGLKQINLYQTVFYGVLKDSPHPERDLHSLGLPSRLAILAGTNYFQGNTVIPPDDPLLHRELYDKLSHADIVRYYLLHPFRFVQKLENAARNAMMIRPYYLGNYEKAAGKPPGSLSFTFSSWSEFKHRTLPNTLGFTTAVFAFYLAGVLARRRQTRDRRGRIHLEVLLLLPAIAAFSLVTPILGDGEADLGKHLFLFNACFDAMLVVMALWIAWVLRQAAERVWGRRRMRARALVPAEREEGQG
ncbi:hypothetical protein [Gorillibacterium sp. CAU 1737]|uniref:glycan biosynthesis hexose transferase WsfD n=1 Tax=Gorillibacterium sp. CAU 1737 TaxID=3140362 RepID=UPI0032604A25